MKNKTKFIDAQKMAVKYPESFYALSLATLDTIKKGSIVKVAVEGERFWVKVTSVKGNKITGKVDNFLVFVDLEVGEKIEFEKRHVYDISEY